MDDVGQRGGGVFFMLTFSQRVYSFYVQPSSASESERRAAFLPSLHLDFDLLTARHQQGVNAAGCSGRGKAVDSLPDGAFYLNCSQVFTATVKIK